MTKLMKYKGIEYDNNFNIFTRDESSSIIYGKSLHDVKNIIDDYHSVNYYIIKYSNKYYSNNKSSWFTGGLPSFNCSDNINDAYRFDTHSQATLFITRAAPFKDLCEIVQCSTS